MSAPAPVIPRLLVDAPPAPQPHKYGLFSAAVVLEDVEPHALTGIEYEAVCSTQVDPYPAPCIPGDMTSRVKTPAQTTAIFNGTPFGIYAADECVLGRQESFARARLRERFAAGEQTTVEQIVYSGVLDNWPNLAQNPEIIPGDLAPDLPDAIGLLERWLATHYGGIGVIHAPMTLAPKFQSLYELGFNGPRSGTILGSGWVFGAGYPGTPPTMPGLVDDGTVWLYATPPVTIRRSRLIEPGTWATGAFDRTQNLGMLITERLYVVDWPCGVAAVKTNLHRPGYVAPPAGDGRGTAAGQLPAAGQLAAAPPAEDVTRELPGLPLPTLPGKDTP